MSNKIRLETIRHRVAIAGQVKDAQTEQVIPGAVVEIADMPESLKSKIDLLAGLYGDDWEKRVERPDRTRTRVDGYFYFQDLPDGKYTLTASLPGTGTRYSADPTIKTIPPGSDPESDQTEVEVSRDPETGAIAIPTVNFYFQPTALEGNVTNNSDDQAVVMAKVEIEGSGEYTFADNDGNYLLSGLEASRDTSSPRQVIVKVVAQGYQQETSQLVDLNQGQVTIQDFSLTRKNGVVNT
ncbi:MULTISPECIES: carboxypeptidase-like regulatory domain-containing protein [Moorena]|uniref:carboxypeptidase-like regulatory domain-containing protein n=2 Tax=Coleofasciculaceae TaxID=1892251 RepID=UPI0002E0038E|nr:MULTISPECIES: carboxypeptidase-like regulatory domain-containing protein [Moorena]NEP65190.1 carboxypeptidase regulatory-like domain-containing protein [Moorena sp. SIO3A5]NEQ13285.1 carboxypeptidase regulatory-like domain-containing protein [Moorena sp. SIO3E2]NER87831.1 carboxypeptidase regulatory-like domain-containing protein [Moorena sp. SIO3A2]NES45387.1 carboxypeptidase regulatory-like domain-containing protein [Moorena sp. SIO2C4]